MGVRVSRVEVKNLLGFKELDLAIDTSLQLIAGPNNAGKSSLVRLLVTFFAGDRRTPLVQMLPLQEYYRAAGPRTMSEVRVWFGDLTETELDEFGPILVRDKFWVALRCSRTGQESFATSKKAPADDARRYYQSVVDAISFVKIPSVRVPDGSGVGGADAIERLVETLESVLVRTGSTRSTSMQQDFAKKLGDVEAVVKEVLDGSAKAIEDELPFEEQKVSFVLPDSRQALRGMLASTVLESGAGAVKVPITSRGTGFQSALILGILKYVATKANGSDSTLFFAIEEPEAFLHPQTQRAMAKIIGEIASSAQVLVTTHSPVIVDSFEISKIARLPLQHDGVVHSWKHPNLETARAGRLTRYCTAANSELVFARAIVLVEGESDFGAVEKWLSTLCGGPGAHYARGLTVIDVGGVTKLQYLVQLADLFKVKCFMLTDKDSIKKSGSNRPLLKAVSGRLAAPTANDANDIRAAADVIVSNLDGALQQQASFNAKLAPSGAHVLSSDLEGLFLDALGVDGVINCLGPSGERAFNDTFVAEVRAASDPRDKLRSWMGSKGWNTDEKTSNKLEPHLAPVLAERIIGMSPPPRAAKPLLEWFRTIADEGKLSPL